MGEEKREVGGKAGGGGTKEGRMCLDTGNLLALA